MADLRIVDAPLLSTVKGTEKLPTGGEGNFSVSVNQVADFAKLKWFLATEGYVDNAVGNVQADLNLHKNNESNPHNVTKSQVGLGNVDNTADLDKPVSNATQSAIITANSGKADKSYVDSQDQLKADKTTVESSLSLKADKVDLIASKILSDGGQTQQVINDFGGAKWYAKSGGYELGATVKLDNGDIVKSTEPNNIIDPNVDITGWVNTKLPFSTPLQNNTDISGATNVTDKLQKTVNDPLGVITLVKGRYLIDKLVIPANVKVDANGAEFVRSQWTGEPLVLCERGSLLSNAKVNGNKTVLGDPTGGSVNRINRGIILRKNARAEYCDSYDHSSHGFYLVEVDVMDFTNPSENQKLLYCKSYNNGFNPGPSGSGDGFCATNTSNSLYFGCEAWGNARTGFVATTYDAITLGENAAYSNNPKADHCKAWDNGYSDFNFECVSQPEISNIEGRDLSFSKSPNAQIHNIAKIGAIYASGADYANVSGIKIENNIRASSLLYIYGKSPQVHNVSIAVGDAASVTGNTVEVVDTVNFDGAISNISINKANIGIIAGVANANNLSVASALSQKYRVRRASGLTSIPDFKSLSNGKIDCYAAAQPTTGVWNKGDMVFNSTLTSNTLGWLCMTSGDYGAVAPAWKVMALNDLQLVGSKTYDPPSLAASGSAGSSATTTVTVTGVVVGDTVIVGFTQYSADIELTPAVSAANTVTVKFKNTSTAAVDLASGTLTVKKI